MTRLFLVVLVFLCFTAPACEPRSEPAFSSQEERLLQTFASLSLLHESFPGTAQEDSLNLYHRQVDSILSANGFTRTTFLEEFERLVDSPNHVQPFLQEIYKRIRKDKPKN